MSTASFRFASLVLVAVLFGLAGRPEPALAQCPTCQNASFGPAIRSIGGDLTYASSIVVADFDRDGIPDLAVARSQGVSVFLGTGGGNFGTEIKTDVYDFDSVIIAGDFNEDGIPDLVVKRFQGVSVLLGGGSGRFSVGPLVPGNINIAAIGVGDFDGDGHLDVATANYGQTVTFLRGDGHGGLAFGGTFPTGLAFPYPGAVAVGDLNGDGRADLVVAGSYPGTSILLGSAAGFGAPTIIDPYQTYGPVQIADVTGDGKPDLLGSVYFGDVVVFPGDGSGGFGAPMSIPMGGDPSSLAIADLNGDGKLDLIAASYQYNKLVTRLGTGGGNFGPIQQWDIGNGPNSLAIADLDGDGIPDFVTAGSSVGIAFGDGAGGVQARVLPMGSEPVSAAIADFDRDGHLDVATVSGDYFGTSVSVRYGDGHGGLSPELRYGAPLWGSVVAEADMNGDGKPDLIVTNGSYSTVTVLLNDGTGAFTVTGTTTGCQAFRPPAVADLNLDGKTDVALACYDSILVLFGDGSGGFSSSITIPAAAIWITAGDVNGDGKPDLVAAHFSSYQVSTLLGDGTGHFGAPILSVLPHYGAGGLVLGDFDGDGHLDVATSAFSQGNNLDVLFGDGTGSFGAPRSFPMLGTTVSLAMDLNGDGRPDVVTVSNARVEVLMNDGAGNFLASRLFGTGSGVPASGDLDEDGLADLVVTDGQSNSITVLLNTSCKARHLAVTPVFPSCSPPNAPLTPAPAVRVTDDGDNVATCAAGTVAASLISGPPGAVLSGTTAVPVASGIATFSNLSLNLAGSNYRLRFTHSGVARPTTGAARVGSGTTVTIAGPATICGNNPASYSAGPGYTRYLWTLDGVPISSEQDTTLGYLAAGPHTLALRVWQNDCEALASVSVQNAPPQFNAIAPSSGPAAGGTPVTVSGACFASGATLALGGTPATAVSVTSSASLSAKTSSHLPGTVPGVVTNPDGQIGTLAGAYTFVCAVTPTASVTGSAVVCAPTTVHLLVHLTGEPPWTLTWSDGYVHSVSANTVQRYVTPTATTTYSIASVIGNFCPGVSTGEAAIVVQNCLAGTPAGSLIPDGRATTGILNPSGNIYVFQPPASSYGMVEIETAFDGQTTLPGGGPAPLIAITRSGGAPLDFAPEFRATCMPDSAGRLFYYASDGDLSAGPLEAHVSDPLSSGYRIRLRAMDTSLFATRWSVNGYRALADLQNTSDCIVEGYIYVLKETGFFQQSIFFSLPPGASLQREIIVSPPSVTKFGSLRVLHDGPAGAITGGVYMTSPANGASFRWPLREARTYGATDGK